MSLSIRRVTRETKIVSESTLLKAQGIYYIQNEDNIMKGTAMIVGQIGTPYVGGFYFFSVEFPDTYPYDPPKILSLTQDGLTRFNPNLYICGKVCLSILNTWNGPSWNVAQTLETVLLSILSAVLNEYPIENEPGYEGCAKKEKSNIYNRVIFHSNIKTAIYEYMSTCSKPKMENVKQSFTFIKGFEEYMKSEFLDKKASILEALETLLIYDGEKEDSIYSMKITYNFKTLKTMLLSLDASL